MGHKTVVVLLLIICWQEKTKMLKPVQVQKEEE